MQNDKISHEYITQCIYFYSPTSLQKKFFSFIHKYSNKQGNCIEVSVQNSSCCKFCKYKLYLVSGSIILSEIQTEITIREFKVEASYSIKMLEIDSK